MEAAASIHSSVQQMRRSGSRTVQLQAANRVAGHFAQTVVQGEPVAPVQAAFAAAGGIEVAVQLLQSATPALQRAAANLLGGACAKNEECAAAAVSDGGVSALLHLLREEARSSAQPDSDILQNAAFALPCCCYVPSSSPGSSGCRRRSACD